MKLLFIFGLIFLLVIVGVYIYTLPSTENPENKVVPKTTDTVPFVVPKIAGSVQTEPSGNVARNVFGNVVGNVFGNVRGNIVRNVIGSVSYLVYVSGGSSRLNVPFRLPPKYNGTVEVASTGIVKLSVITYTDSTTTKGTISPTFVATTGTDKEMIYPKITLPYILIYDNFSFTYTPAGCFYTYEKYSNPQDTSDNIREIYDEVFGNLGDLRIMTTKTTVKIPNEVNPTHTRITYAIRISKSTDSTNSVLLLVWLITPEEDVGVGNLKIYSYI
jgi:hypothetical protein